MLFLIGTVPTAIVFVVSYRYRTYGLGAGSDALGSETDPDSYRLFILGSFLYQIITLV